MTDLLLCGGTGLLGSRIAALLAERGIPFRALVRTGSDTTALRVLGAELCIGDLTERASLDRAVGGVRTVVTTVASIGRALAGDRAATVHGVDRAGNANLVRAAEAAGVERFVFVSIAGLTPRMAELSPFAAAKRSVDELLAASPMRTVIVRPAPFQETWLSPETGIDPAKRRAVIFGRGGSPANDVAVDDVAEAVVRLATMHDPPGEIELGGPEALSRQQVVDAFQRAYGVRFRRICVPRAVLALGARALRGRRPELASVLGMSLVRDLDGEQVDPEPLRRLGIVPRATSDRIVAMAGEVS